MHISRLYTLKKKSTDELLEFGLINLVRLLDVGVIHKGYFLLLHINKQFEINILKTIPKIFFKYLK